MPAYIIVDIIRIKDEAKMAEYRSRVVPVVEKFGGKYLAVGGRFEVVEGKWRPTFPVILSFPSLEQARTWYNSEEYRELKKLRQAASDVDAVFIEGLPEE
jgi:uncharacterized protein (DUF1330 family)